MTRRTYRLWVFFRPNLFSRLSYSLKSTPTSTVNPSPRTPARWGGVGGGSDPFDQISAYEPIAIQTTCDSFIHSFIQLS